MKLIGKTENIEVKGYDTCHNFPYEWIEYRTARVITYWFLFMPIYKVEGEER